MFYIDKLKEQIAKVTETTTAALARIDSSEFAEEAKRQYPGHSIAPSQLGYLSGIIRYSALPAIAHAACQLEQALPEITHMERLLSLCESIGIDDTNIGEFEVLVKDSGYRSTFRDLQEQIREAAEEVRDGEREVEQQNAVAMLETAGFVGVERDDFEGWERVGVAPAVERVTITMRHPKRRGHIADQEFWYDFTVEVDGTETAQGKSGQFGELLKAVGISQEVAK